MGRPFRTALVLLVALVTLSAGAPLARPVVRTLPGGAGVVAFVSGDRVYVVRPLDWRPGAVREIVAYRGGRERWRSRLPGPGEVVSVWEMGGRVLAAGATGDDETWETTAYDADTGRISWQQAALAYPAGDALMLEPTRGSGPREVRRVAVADGRTVWTAPGADDLRLAFRSSGALDRLLLAPETGETVVLDATTGARLAARDLHPGEPPAPRQMMAAGELLLESRAGDDAVDAYEMDTLLHRWTARLPPLSHVEPCGALLCAGQSGEGMTALDPATGAVRWTTGRWAGVVAADAGRLLAVGGDTGGDRLAVLDETDGRLVADLKGWAIVPQDEAAERLFLTRPLGGGRLLLAELDLSGDLLPVRGVLFGTDCAASRALLVCRDSDGDFATRRLP
ncbi:PQQ-binding-like beta-propeller repeat protein [Micromonospora sp. WMMD975]|uniref:outer membrane protein assembly factor BamB family protein n=1 Tax=Micromonospora sp. WMMD975 TaxID=3016087 RepID=UPI00249BCE78|nr:PQQ-binding-like beta-propeller repeat protein [Micromonospora sp. WMMD975]WFE34434.1 PQQ-binding-like beta-propeller repeat protein [Micromonospora sp. WMMD975]